MKLIVRINTGKTIVLEVERTDTIEDVKNKIEAAEYTIPTDRQRLITQRGVRLEDQRTLMDYNLGEGSIIFCIFFRNMYEGLNSPSSRSAASGSSQV